MILKKVIETLLALIIGLVAAYALVCLYALALGDYFLFASQEPTYVLTPEYKATATTKGHIIPILYLPTEGARYTILYSHGNLEDLGFIRPRLESFRKHGFNVLGYDYPGFGQATGQKTEAGVFDSALAAYNYLTQTLKVDPSTIIVYGRSMGGGATAYLASTQKVGGVVMHSTFVSAFRVQTGIRLLPWDRFENLKRIPQIKAPIFFVHGLSDETIPAWHTRMMISAAKAPSMNILVPFALHNNVMEIARDDYWEEMTNFIGLIEKPSPLSGK